jgi:RND superfamily putative drug exporter
MARILTNIGGFSARHKWSVISVWLVVLVVVGAGAATLAKPLDSTFTIDGLASVTTLDQIDQEFGLHSDDSGTIVFAAPEGQKLTAADRAAVAILQQQIADLPGVDGTPRQTLSPAGQVGFLSVNLTSDAVPDGLDVAVDAARSPDLQVAASSDLTTEDDSSSPALGLLIALIVLLITFGSLVAAGFPLVTALIGLGISECGIFAITKFVTLTSVAPSLATLLALAVGIDYSLFIINRHRRHLLEGMAVRESIALAVGTAGSAVFFAATTVIIALAGLAVMRIGFLTQMGVSGAVAVLIAMLVSLTLTPALLAVAGQRVLGRRTRRRLAAGTLKPSGTFARRWAAMITAHPVLPVVLSVLVLGALAAPVLDMRLGLPDDGSQPSTSTVRQSYDLMAEGFGPGANGPILVLGTAAQEEGIASVPGVASVQPSGQHGDQVLLTVYPDSAPNDPATTTLVHTLRERPGLEVTGQTAVAIDVSELVANRLPLYLGLIVGFTFLLLLVVFRSLLVPLKATISFLLSLGAALGCTVAVFQQGHLGGLFGVDPAGPLLSFLPVLVIGVLFGLSMDYEMFLLTGMQERHAAGEGACAAVVSGFGNGARVVVSAALIMISVFGDGAITGDSTIKPIAFALSVGVLVDAFMVRLVLVPAVMRLFGAGAWWLPRWLDRVTPQVDLEGAALTESSGTVANEGRSVGVV